MPQAWLQVIGLCLDMLGFGLILWEWVLAQRHEAHVREMSEREARQADGFRHLHQAMQPSAEMQRHHEMAAESRRRLAAVRLADTSQHYRATRLGVIYWGACAVMAGFLVQLLGAWPGCCVALGIQPS